MDKRFVVTVSKDGVVTADHTEANHMTLNIFKQKICVSCFEEQLNTILCSWIFGKSTRFCKPLKSFNS